MDKGQDIVSCLTTAPEKELKVFLKKALFPRDLASLSLSLKGMQRGMLQTDGFWKLNPRKMYSGSVQGQL